MKKINEKNLEQIFLKLKYEKDSAIEELYLKYGKLIYSVGYSVLKNKTDTEDLVQIVFCKLYTMDEKNLPIQKYASWLYTLTRNEAITFIRRKRNNLSLEDIYEIQDQNDEVNNIVNKSVFNSMIKKLNDKEKQIVTLKILSNLSFEEIAKLLNIPEGTVKWRYYKAMANLKILLSNLGISIIAFAIGLKELQNKKSKQNEQNTLYNNIKTNEDEITKKDQEKIEDDYKSVNHDKENLTNILTDETENQEGTFQEEINVEEINNYQIGMMQISVIFLVIAIIFSIIFSKYQLKRKIKTSKY